MKWLIDAIKAVADIVTGTRDIVHGVRDARRADVNDALQSTAAGRAAHEASKNAHDCRPHPDAFAVPPPPGRRVCPRCAKVLP